MNPNSIGPQEVCLKYPVRAWYLFLLSLWIISTFIQFSCIYFEKSYVFFALLYLPKKIQFVHFAWNWLLLSLCTLGIILITFPLICCLALDLHFVHTSIALHFALLKTFTYNWRHSHTLPIHIFILHLHFAYTTAWIHLLHLYSYTCSVSSYLCCHHAGLFEFVM